MKFQGIKFISINELSLSQIYLSEDKIKAVLSWFNPKNMDNFEPLSVYDFGNGRYTLTDGHTRAYIAYINGVTTIPVVYDNDEIVTGEIAQKLYKEDIIWCERFGLNHIKDLENRIISQDKYQKLWIIRCDKSYNLITNTSVKKRNDLQKLVPNLFLYGASENMQVLYFENEIGELFVYKDDVINKEFNY